ncbi:hypothetical protein SAMN05216190_14228 [Pseudomonas borbori]|uniref:HTH IS21-type domain-containing protein n=1 Tax=Pseudomonas borbori TaxID=289003 RepID=A0A1I5WR93_9PSED|nr:hypothetical protein SAMN05216190_14228 [Pseudomonas borbori]
MISMEMMGKIRRMYFRDKLSLHEIAKRTGLARNTIRKWIRAPEVKQPVYLRRAIFNKLSAFHATLEQALKADSLRPGNSGVVPRRCWRKSRPRVTTVATASSPRLSVLGAGSRARRCMSSCR